MKLKDAKDILSSGKGTLRCGEVKGILEDLGYTLRLTKKGHYVYKHSGLNGFFGGNFCCPHKTGAPVKNCYITSILRDIREYESELLTCLGGEDD